MLKSPAEEWKLFITNTEKEMYQEIVNAAKNKDIICDTVLQNVEDFKKAELELKEVNVVWVLIYCSLEKLPERAKIRLEKQDVSQNSRPLFWALEQFGNIYRTTKQTDECIDTIFLKDFDVSIRAAIEYDSNLNLSWYKFDEQRFGSLINKLKQKIFLNNQEIVFLFPIFNYDLIIDNSYNSFFKTSDDIQTFLKKEL